MNLGKFRVVKDFPCGDGGILHSDSEIVLDGPIDHPDLVNTGAMKAIIEFGLIIKPDSKPVHLPSIPIDQARIEPSRQLVIVPGDLDTYFKPISHTAHR